MIHSELKVGEIYEVTHKRKGTFEMIVESVNDIWVEGTILSGYVKAAMIYNYKRQFDKVTIRKSFCTFKLKND